jgi:hypothetical protein
MNLYGVLDIPTNQVIAHYEGKRETYVYPWSDRVQFMHFLVAPGNYAEGYSLDGNNNLIYDVGYQPPIINAVKVITLSDDGGGGKHFHNINYNTELSQSIFPKRVFTKGELTSVVWYSDQLLTNKLLDVTMVYVRDAMGFAVSRTTTRKWVREDESFHPLFKITTKSYTINPIDQILEGKRRRSNIVDGVQLPVMSFLLETQSGTLTQGEILLMGRDFLDAMEPFFNRFVKNSSSINDVASPDFGKKEIVVEFETSTDAWLDDLPAALGGATIRQYLIGEFSI